MAKPDAVLVYVDAYPSEAAAQAERSVSRWRCPGPCGWATASPGALAQGRPATGTRLRGGVPGSCTPGSGPMGLLSPPSTTHWADCLRRPPPLRSGPRWSLSGGHFSAASSPARQPRSPPRGYNGGRHGPMGFPDEEPPSSTATRHSSPVIRLAATTPRPPHRQPPAATQDGLSRHLASSMQAAHPQTARTRRIDHRPAHCALRPRSPRNAR